MKFEDCMRKLKIFASVSKFFRGHDVTFFSITELLHFKNLEIKNP